MKLRIRRLGVRIPPSALCDVARHRKHPEPLTGPADEFAGGGMNDTHLEVVDEHDHASAAECGAQTDVVHAAVDAQGDAPGLVDAVVANAVVGVVAAVAGGRRRWGYTAFALPSRSASSSPASPAPGSTTCPPTTTASKVAGSTRWRSGKAGSASPGACSPVCSPDVLMARRRSLPVAQLLVAAGDPDRPIPRRLPRG
jgi:hypothetical protein